MVPERDKTPKTPVVYFSTISPAKKFPVERGNEEMLSRRTLSGIVLLLACLAGCRAGEETGGGLRKISLQLNWFPEAEHGGYYAARLNGYYAEEGLDVELLPGGPGGCGTRLTSRSW